VRGNRWQVSHCDSLGGEECVVSAAWALYTLWRRPMVRMGGSHAGSRRRTR